MGRSREREMTGQGGPRTLPAPVRQDESGRCGAPAERRSGCRAALTIPLKSNHNAKGQPGKTLGKLKKSDSAARKAEPLQHAVSSTRRTGETLDAMQEMIGRKRSNDQSEVLTTTFEQRRGGAEQQQTHAGTNEQPHEQEEWRQHGSFENRRGE
jgi:hypothetical protein